VRPSHLPDPSVLDARLGGVPANRSRLACRLCASLFAGSSWRSHTAVTRHRIPTDDGGRGPIFERPRTAPPPFATADRRIGEGDRGAGGESWKESENAGANLSGRLLAALFPSERCRFWQCKFKKPAEKCYVWLGGGRGCDACGGGRRGEGAGSRSLGGRTQLVGLQMAVHRHGEIVAAVHPYSDNESEKSSASLFMFQQ
jgi:hypothetical protein